MKTKNTVKKIAKWLLIIAAIMLSILLAAVITHISSEKLSSVPEKPDEMLYSDEPSDWISDKPDNAKEIKIEEITGDKAYIEGGTEQYIDEEQNLWTAFKLDGVYDGNIFAKEYMDEDNKTKMRITRNMNPDDGVIEGFIIADIENASEELVWIYIFLDEDWKKQVEFTNIFFGLGYQYYKPFNFTQVSPGTYMDKVMDDPSRHAESFGISASGVAVGNIKPENIIENTIDGLILIRIS